MSHCETSYETAWVGAMPYHTLALLLLLLLLLLLFLWVGDAHALHLLPSTGLLVGGRLRLELRTVGFLLLFDLILSGQEEYNNT